MPDPTFTAAPDDIPSRGTPSTFSVLTDPFLVWQKTNRNEMSGAVPWFADSVTATAADVVTTAADVVSTNADVVSTGDDVTAATAQVELATTQANNAAGSATTALGYLNAFEGSYIGQYADDAAADASGFTIGAGVFYFKDSGLEATSGLRIYNGTWGAAVLDAGGALLSANSLSDVASASDARTNIGALSISSNLSDLASAEISRDSLGLRWLVKSAAYTAVAGEKVAADVTAGAWTLTLPLTPISGAVVMVSVIDGDAATNNLTIDGNGNNIQGDTTLIYDVPLATVWLVYNNTEWRLA
jgi:hypothetical protein